MAEAKKALSIAEIKAKRQEFEDMIAAQMKAERPAALAHMKEQIDLFKFTAAELGLHAPAAGAAGKGGAGGSRNIGKPLKSTTTGKIGVWLNYPPTFLETEGAFTAYKGGKSIDGWLVNPADKKGKINFLKKLAKHENKQPTKEQLGDVTEAEFKAA